MRLFKPKTRPEKPEVWLTHPAMAEERRERHRQALLAPYHRKALVVQLAIFAVVLALWPLPIINPVKLLTVLFHEMSHVGMALLTGGRVFGVAIDPGGAGITLGIGGSEGWIVLAGYAGSFLIGALLFLLSAKWDPAEVWLCLCVFVGATLMMGWLNEFTALFAWSAIILLALGQMFLAGGAKRFLLRVFATTSCLYPILDIGGEMFRLHAEGFRIAGRVAGSDVSRLAEIAHAPPFLIGFLCCAVGLVLVVWLVDWTARHNAEEEARRSLRSPLLGYRPRRRKTLHYNPNDPTTVREYRLR